MWTGMLWFALLTAAGLCYPRRPRTAGVLWIALGVLSAVLSYPPDPGTGLGSLSGVFIIALGVGYLIKYRKADVRAKHNDYWTARA